MINDKNIVAIIPARGGSTRLSRKNIRIIWGSPMIYWAIRACQNSRYIDEVFVSTEDEEIKNISMGFGAGVIDRPKLLADNVVYKQDVIVHAAQKLVPSPDILVSIQANSPEVSPKDLDGAIEKLVKYDRNEIITMNDELIQNAAFRIMKYEYAFCRSLSWRTAAFVTDYVDIHTEDDLKYVEDHRIPAEIAHEKKN